MVRLLTAAEVGHLLGLRTTRVVRMAKNRELPHVEITRDEIRFDQIDLAEFVDGRRRPIATAPAAQLKSR
jgi:hypothetical protein